MYGLIGIGRIGAFGGIGTGSVQNVKKFSIRYRLFYSSCNNEYDSNQHSTKLPN